jgi:hypothetical protein
MPEATMRKVRDVIDAMAAEMAQSPLMPFGKWRNYRVKEMVARDPGYARWLVRQPWFREHDLELHRLVLAELSARR